MTSLFNVFSSLYAKKVPIPYPFYHKLFLPITQVQAHFTEDQSMQTNEQPGLQSLTASQLASILQINERTVNVLVRGGMIPHNSIRDAASNIPLICFNPGVITGWLCQGPALMTDEKDQLEKLKAYYESAFPDAIKALKEFDSRFSFGTYQPKGYSLCKVTNKRHGFLYYVRYFENGKLIPSRWCTHTNDRASAEQFARDNRTKIIEAYFYRKNHGLYAVLSNYYKEGSIYYEHEKDRGRVLSARTTAIYHNFTNKILIPFLRKKGIQSFDEITPPVIAALQNNLLKKGNKPQTVNRSLGILKAVLDYLVMHGKIEENVFAKVTMLKARKKHYHVRGCHEIKTLKGVFQKTWADPFSYLLYLIIYTTGMRNSEIERVQARDVITIEGCAFIDIPKSKTENGTRIVPLHPFVCKKLLAYITETGKEPDDYVFSKDGRHIQSPVYKKANEDMGKVLKLEEKDMESISFYSGRHFWKTLMSSEDLGNIEEYFMGHKVSKDVKKLYNHLDKQGQKKIAAKAKESFKILDKCLFT
jgi:integrase